MGAGIPPIDPPAIGETSPSDPEDGARPKSVPEVLVDLATEGEPVPTGFPPLDRQFRRGGLIPGSILVIGGPPHTGKTTLAEQIGLHMAKTMPVVALFADEGVKPAARRAALMCHIPEHILDAQPARAVELAKAALAEHSFTLWPTEATAATASAVVAYVVEKFAGMPAVVILDSIQTIPMSDDDDASSPRLAAKALVSQCRRWASAHSITFILTSQSNRASYRSKKSDDNSEAIASFSETGAIEYMADVAVVLALPDDSEIVQARLVKNRLKGTGKSFSIRFSAETYSMLEADDAEIESAVINAKSEKLAPLKKEILKLLADEKELSQREISERCEGSHSLVRDALKSLVIHDKSVTAAKRQGKGGGFAYSLKYTPSGTVARIQPPEVSDPK
jgi:KaiC/GvpD/RAD55 family RecA-like ATPase